MSSKKVYHFNSRMKQGRAQVWMGLLTLLLALMLAACGGEEAAMTLPTTGPVVAIGPGGSGTAAATSPTSAPPTAQPTSTPAIIALPPTATPLPPTPTSAPSTAQPTSTPAPSRPTSPTAQPTALPQPAETGTPAPLDPAAELKVIKAAYDALNKNFYTQPPTDVIAQKGLEETATALNQPKPAGLKWGDAEANWKLFESEFTRLVSGSSLQLPPRVLAHRIVNVMAAATGDLHTYYLDERRAEAWNRMTRGDNSTLGFGAFFILYQNNYYVQRLTTGSPAQLAGGKVGDRLVSFDGGNITDAASFTRLSRGLIEKRQYDFTFERPGQAARLNLRIEYARYTVPTAEWQIVNNHIGFITLNAFHVDVASKLDEAIAGVKGQGADSLIIDLRFNGGGYAFERVAGRFVRDGETLGSFTTRGIKTTLKARSDGKFVDPPLPLAVLIDRNSASASEVFSLAVKDYKAGTIIGSKSAGAIGTVRAWPLGDGTLLAVTASVYETVLGEKLNNIGVTPDIVVARSTADILAGRDPQLDAAVKHLEDKSKARP